MEQNRNCIDNLKIETKSTLVDENKPKLTVKEKRNLILSFPYNKKIIQEIKSLEYRKWLPEKKSWEISKNEAGKLYEKIKHLIDCKELEKFLIPFTKITEKTMLKDYNYLTKKPFEHQIEAAQFLINKKRAILADEMGVGKTLSSIMAAFSLPPPRIIVCPASLKLNWQREIRGVDQDGIVKIVKNDFEVADWVIINYDLLIKYQDDIDEVYWTCSIFDEAHFIKSIDQRGNPSSKRSKLGLEISRNSEYVFLLTGTPMTARPKDLFNLLSAVNHPIAHKPSDFYQYAQNYCGPTNNGYGWDYRGSSNTQELHEKIKNYMLRRLKKDLLDLPEKTRNFIPVDVNLKKYQKAVLNYITRKKGIKGIVGHLAHFNIMRHMLSEAKIGATIELAENILESNEPVIIFTNFNIVVDSLLEYFGDRSVKLTGSCSLKARQAAIDSFQNGNKDVFISNLLAGGVGITLTRANQIIVNDFDWTPANHAQGEDRIHRIGAKQKCTIQYVYASSAEVDEKMAEILAQKLSIISTVIDGGNDDQENMIEEIIKIFL